MSHLTFTLADLAAATEWPVSRVRRMLRKPFPAPFIVAGWPGRGGRVYRYAAVDVFPRLRWAGADAAIARLMDNLQPHNQTQLNKEFA